MAVKVVITDNIWRDLRRDAVFPGVEGDAVVEGAMI